MTHRDTDGPGRSSASRAGRALAFWTLVLILTGCAGAERPLTLEEFYAFCWPSQINYDCWDDSLCQTYKDYLAQEHASKQECIKGCNTLQMEEYRQNALRGCDVPIRDATDWCEQYCRRYFDYGPPAQGAEQGTRSAP